MVYAQMYTKSKTDELLAAKQNVLTAGTGITIVNDVISATGGGSGDGWIKCETLNDIKTLLPLDTVSGNYQVLPTTAFKLKVYMCDQVSDGSSNGLLLRPTMHEVYIPSLIEVSPDLETDPDFDPTVPIAFDTAPFTTQQAVAQYIGITEINGDQNRVYGGGAVITLTELAKMAYNYDDQTNTGKADVYLISESVSNAGTISHRHYAIPICLDYDVYDGIRIEVYHN